MKRWRTQLRAGGGMGSRAVTGAVVGEDPLHVHAHPLEPGDCPAQEARGGGALLVTQDPRRRRQVASSRRPGRTPSRRHRTAAHPLGDEGPARAWTRSPDALGRLRRLQADSSCRGRSSPTTSRPSRAGCRGSRRSRARSSAGGAVPRSPRGDRPADACSSGR